MVHRLLDTFLFQTNRCRKSCMRAYVWSQRLWSSVSCVSSGYTISSKYTFRARNRFTRPIVCENSTLRSSSLCQMSTGDFQLSIAEIAEDLYETSAESSEFPQR